jgi:hypothetical protein
MPRSEGSSESHETSGGESRWVLGQSDVVSRTVATPGTPRERGPEYYGPRPIRNGSLGFKVDLEGLAGKKVPALRISADGSRIEEIMFDGNEHWHYEAVRSDRKKAILTKKHTELDIKNSLANNYLRGHSDAAKNPDSRAALEDLHGEVIVLGYDPVLGKPTGLTELQWTDLAATLEVIDPTISVERMQEP